MDQLSVALISSEIGPFAKTGGLADVLGSLGEAFKLMGAKPTYIMPKYRRVSEEGLIRLDQKISFIQNHQHVQAAIWEGEHPSGIPIYFIDMPHYFDRPGIYGEHGDYHDNCERFASFSRASIELLKILNIKTDVIHIHDWQTALIPLYLKTIYASDDFFKGTRSILTIHNLGYQGLFDQQEFHKLELNSQFFTPKYLEFYGRINFLKAGLVSADALTTVSETYAKEVLTPQFGFGLHGVLKKREDHFKGILNGIDMNIWNPKTDTHLTARYCSQSMEGKQVCKAALQQEMQLPVLPQKPIVALMSRLVDQKGIDIVTELMTYPGIEKLDFQFIVHGQGDIRLEQALNGLMGIFPGKVVTKIGYYDEALAHRIEAGADFFLMPSRYEPCGLNQMYSLRYGTIPIVRRVGGLSDTVIDVDHQPNEGTGFHFKRASTTDLEGALKRALSYFDNPTTLNQIRERGMKQDFSWDRSAGQYLNFYDSVLSKDVHPVEV